MELVEMVHTQTTTPAMKDSATGDGFFNDNTQQRHSIAIDMLFYWVRDRVIQEQFLVYFMTGEKNLADHLTNHHTTSHHQAQRSTYIIPTSEISKYACYMSPIYLLGCVEYLPTRGNGQQAEKVSLLRGKEMDNGRTETNRPNNQPRYQQRSYRPYWNLIILVTVLVYKPQGYYRSHGLITSTSLLSPSEHKSHCPSTQPYL